MTLTESRGPSTPTGGFGLVEHFFRREYGRLVAVLTRKAGLRHIAAFPRIPPLGSTEWRTTT